MTKATTGMVLEEIFFSNVREQHEKLRTLRTHREQIIKESELEKIKTQCKWKYSYTTCGVGKALRKVNSLRVDLLSLRREILI